MKTHAILSVLSACYLTASTASASNPKRGLIYIPNSQWPQDDSIWVQPNSALSWYYTYNDRPDSLYSGLEFVPMMWGMGGDSSDTSFYNSVVSLKASGVNIEHALSFNEPDMISDWGGSNLTPERAAEGYVANFVPLRREAGLKIGLPAVSGASWGIQWLKDFRGNCTEIMVERGLGSECEWDFLPVHWYDNLEGLQAHINEAVAEFPNTKIWVTEYALAHQDLASTQAFYDESIAYLDGTDVIERYSYFGAFRSQVSNVGANATFLSQDGQLTQIGARYLGVGTTGVDPTSG